MLNHRSTLTAEELNDLKHMIDEYDKDKDGLINTKRDTRALAVYEHNEARDAISDFDANNDGALTLGEFMAFIDQLHSKK
ncbi:hypothetical protein BGZ52_009575 [Haplosporangium bisporale]|nr:hypothetical protein BGZ52_009575 [Haplosporangium bisporale]